MAQRFKKPPSATRELGRRTLNYLGVLFILLFVFQPGWAGSSSGDDGGGGCSSSGSQSSSSSYIADEVLATYSEGSPLMDLAGIDYNESIESDGYVARLLGGASNRFDARLPGYSYFQGVAQANGHISLAGQVRVVGAVLGADMEDATASFYQGAMVTTNAQAFFGAGSSLVGGPDGIQTRIKSWEIVPEG